MQPYKINESFTVIPQNNLINELKLEPRLMKLLCLLVDKPGALITREEIIEKIWNGYGGGDEGLTQAISFLRKILNDSNKTIIETVPKSGYIFHGEVQMLPANQTHPAHTTEPEKHINIWLIIMATVILLSICTLFFYRSGSNKNYTPKADTSVTPSPNTEVAPKAK